MALNVCGVLRITDSKLLKAGKVLLTPVVAMRTKSAGRLSKIEHVHEHVYVYDHGIDIDRLF